MEDNNATQEKNKGNKNWIAIGIVVIALIILLIGGGYYYMNSQKQKSMIEEKLTSPVEKQDEKNASDLQSSNYKDGTYTADGTYSYHSGAEKLGVTVTLVNGQVEDVTLEKKAVAPASVKMQDDFETNYKTLVVGKNISQIKLGKVSGSSLTPEGFNDAIEQIKTQASES